MPRWLGILLVSLAGLLLEVGYTRIVSYKFWYYYTYLVIGLALLGIGSGSVFVAVFSRMRQWSTDRILAGCGLFGAVSITLGYLVVAHMRVDTVQIWDYGTGASFSNTLRLAIICLAIFLTFVSFGIIVAVLLGRAGEGIARMYFSDLLGAGIGALLAIPLISRLGPPRVIVLAALIFAVVGVLAAVPFSLTWGVSALVSIALLVTVVPTGVLPDVRPELSKWYAPVTRYSAWGPVFRVDVVQLDPTGNSMLLLHDATFGSGIRRWNGDPSTLTAYEKDPRSIPFAVLGNAPKHELIIGSAGGNEILASLYNRAPNVEAVELNPVTVSLLRKHFADYTGHIPEKPAVHLHLGDGRSYLERHKTKYDLVWYVAPDSYAATNAASSGALVLSESYLYTQQMIKKTLEHLSDNGIMVVQFGELDFNRPNRTSRYVVTARKALEEIGVKDPRQHLLVAAEETANRGALSTIAVKRTAFTPAEIDRFLGRVAQLPDHHPLAAPDHAFGTNIVSQLASGTNAEVASTVAHSRAYITAISDNSPYFWHFSRFRSVIRHIATPLTARDPENVVGERVLLLMLGLSLVYAALFLLAPFVAVRRKWRALPAKTTSAVYFSALGLGFMFYEVTMIQRLVQFLGYPTLSLTVTLAAILVSTGIGALASHRFTERPKTALPVVLGVLAVLTVFYQFALPGLLTGPLLSWPTAGRILFSVVILAPLGLCLGTFMPLGLARVASLTGFAEEYVAWSWAVNGFFSVIGAVLTTILSMAFGYRAVQFAALVLYAIAVAAFTRLPSPSGPAVTADEEPELSAAPV